MFRLLKKKQTRNKAQVISEYAGIVVLVIIVLSTMTMYIKRALQARIRDTFEVAMTDIKDAYEDSYTGEALIPSTVNLFYEPYYTNVTSDVTRDLSETRFLRLGGDFVGAGGVGFDSKTESETDSTQGSAEIAD